jgi:succinate dehydrogenase/fumarate reductase flavoprotein subunit
MSIEADLVVVGFGAAGAAAAVAAADLGGDVVILEKLPEDGHTPSSAMSGGIVMVAVDPDRATTYLDACSEGMVPREVSVSFARLAYELPGWLDRIGADLALRIVRGAQHPTLPESDSLEVYTSTARASLPEGVEDVPKRIVDPYRGAGTTPEDFFSALRLCVKRRERIRVLWESPAVRLHRSEEGVVDAVRASTADGEVEVRARKGVVLATGGFGWDEELKLNYLRAYPMYFYGNPGNTGDSVRLAQDVGASLWHMNQVFGRGCFHFEDAGAGYTFNATIYPSGTTFNDLPEIGFAITDRFGRRYASEWDQAIPVKHTFIYKMIEYDAERHLYPRIPSWWFFDSRRIDGGKLTSRNPRYEWSADNRREVERGWIHEGETPEAAAAAAGIEDPSVAAETIAEYNRACAAGADPFGRPAESLVPLDSPPYYCVALYPGGTATSGGPRIDARARVLDPFGSAIPGLYAAGEVSFPFGMLYPSSGCSLTAGLCFGRAAAETALA